MSFMPAGAAADAATVREGAGFAIRALARVIDTVVHFFVALLAGVVAGLAVGIGSAIRGVRPDESVAALGATTPVGFAAAALGALALHVASEWLHGSTIGKRICGLTVVSEDGGPAGFAAVLKRSLAYFLDALFFGLIAKLKMDSSPRRQRYGDVWGRTQVVRLAGIDPGERRSFLRFALGALAGMTVDGTIILVELASRLA